MDVSPRKPRMAGLSMFEMFLTVGLLAVMGSVGFVVFSDVFGNAKQTKLVSDVKALNSAVLSYIAANGDLSGAQTPKDVIAKLKKVSSNNRHNGLRDSFLDGRVDIEFQSAEDAAKGKLRAYWDQTAMRFVVSDSGPPGGISTFFLNDAAAASNRGDNAEERGSVMSLAAQDKWIWDYVEVPPAALPGPSVMTTVSVPPPTTAPIPVAMASPVPAITPLSDPILSTPPGSYPITNYDLNVTIVNPNPAGSSDVYYRIGFGTWERYLGGSLTITPGLSVDAQSIARDPGSFENSGIVRGTYEATAIQLIPPTITPDNAEFSLFGDTDITVALVDNNSGGNSLLEFRVDGGPWMSYTGPFLLPGANYPGGANVEARAISSGSPYYLTSTTSLEFIPIEAVNLSGNTVGEFNNPLGPSGMVTNLGPGASSSYFEWGDVNGNGRSTSWMEFYGGTFNDIIDGQQFSVGSMTYYNGTINSGTGADSVGLEIALDLDINGRTYRPYFDFTFELINTPNSNDEIASADFVYLDDARSSRTIVFDGYEFEFELRFGETTANGFSEFDKFHVIENRDASVNLYGMFNLLGPATDPGAGTNEPIGGVLIDDDPNTGIEGDILYQKIGYVDPEEQIKSLLPTVQALADEAEDARNIAVKAEETANKASQDILVKIDDLKLFDAFLLYEEALRAADEAEREAIIAEAASREGQPYSDLAKQISLSDPRAADEAIRVADEVNASSLFATRARSAATAARLYANNATSAWNNALNNASGSANGMKALAEYYAQVAAEEKNVADTALRQAGDSSQDALSAATDMNKKIAEGKYLEAERLYEQIAPLALLARTSAEGAEAAAVRARAAADEAAAIAAQEASAGSDAGKADRAATDAESYALGARSESDLATAASNDADSVWNDLLANGATNNPEAFANYLADQARVALDLAKLARDTAKNESEDAVKFADDSAKKAAEGKFGESDALRIQAQDAMARSTSAADSAQNHADESRALAVQAGAIAGSAPIADSAYQEAVQSADDAEAYSQEAAQWANDALAAVAALP